MNTKDKIKVMQQALIDGKILWKLKSKLGEFYTEISNTENVDWNWDVKIYKNIDKPKYIPFTIEDADLFIGKAVHHKTTPDNIGIVNGAKKDGIQIGGIFMTYKKAFNELSMLNKPFGKLKK